MTAIVPNSEKNRKRAAIPRPAGVDQPGLFDPLPARSIALAAGEVVRLTTPGGDVFVSLGTDGGGIKVDFRAPAPALHAAAPAAGAPIALPIAPPQGEQAPARKKKPPAWPPERVDALRAAVARPGATWDAIGAEFGISPDRARRLARRFGLARVPAPEIPPPVAATDPSPPAAPPAEPPAAAPAPPAAEAPARRAVFWTKERDEKLVAAVAVNRNWAPVAAALGCSPDAAASRARRLGLKLGPVAPEPPAGSPAPPPPVAVAEAPARRVGFWTKERDAALVEAAAACTTWDEVGARLGCMPGAARMRALRLRVSLAPAEGAAPDRTPPQAKPAAASTAGTPDRVARVTQAAALPGATWARVAAAAGTTVKQARRIGRRLKIRLAPPLSPAARSTYWTTERDEALAKAVANPELSTWPRIGAAVGCGADRARRRADQLKLVRPARAARDRRAEEEPEPAEPDGEPAPGERSAVLISTTRVATAKIEAFRRIVAIPARPAIVLGATATIADDALAAIAASASLPDMPELLAALEADICFLWTGSIEQDAALARAIRRHGNRNVIVALSECIAPKEAVAIDSGCDAVWQSPREPAEIIPQILKALELQRRARRSTTRRIGNVTLDYANRVFRVADHVDLVKLTLTEFELLDLLFRHRGAGVSVDDFRRLRSETAFADAARSPRRSSRDVHLVRLRKKLSDAGGNIEIVSRDGKAFVRPVALAAPVLAA